ncbi:MAG: RNA pseudouridine synthase [Rhodobiaceae bacterium]|nr:RNA pseudouridine synthase [Rhodobiaceae bacterium]
MVDTPNNMLAFAVTYAQEGDRLDRTLAAASDDLSRARLQELVKAGHCVVTRRQADTTIKDPSWRVKQDDIVALTLPPPTDTSVKAQNIALNVLYEDADLLVINKPSNMVVHPAPGSPDGTLVNALLAHCGDSLSGIGGEKRPGIVHRLDKDTSGIMVVAKNDAAHQGLSEQFAAHGRDGRMQRLYQALVWGEPVPAAGTVDAALARSANNRKKVAVSKSNEARHAVTHYRRLASFVANQVSMIECRLETGRTHQIRVHMAHIGHPVLGDKLYGTGMKSRTVHLTEAQKAALDALDRQALHAAALGFQHPRTGETHFYEAPLPQDLFNLLEAMAKLPI